MENMDPDVNEMVKEVDNMVRAKLRKVRSICIIDAGYATLCSMITAGSVMCSLNTRGTASSLLFLIGLLSATAAGYCVYETAKCASWLWVFRNYERDIKTKR